MIAQLNVYAAAPWLAVSITESVWFWSAEHKEGQTTGDDSVTAVITGSLKSETENDRALPPVQGDG
jgi:hypothetical protein